MTFEDKLTLFMIVVAVFVVVIVAIVIIDMVVDKKTKKVTETVVKEKIVERVIVKEIEKAPITKYKSVCTSSPVISVECGGQTLFTVDKNGVATAKPNSGVSVNNKK